MSEFKFNTTRPIDPQTPVDVDVSPWHASPPETSIPEPVEEADSAALPYVEVQVETSGGPTRFPRGAAERILALSPAELSEFQAIRNKCRVDTIFCGNFLLGMSLSENPHRSFVNFFVHRKINTPLADLDPDFKRRLLLAPRGSAKALDCQTPIPTPSGIRLMRDIHVGDLVFDESGHPCKVTLESPIYLNRPCYEVEFSTGDKIICDEAHLWTTAAHTDVRTKPGTSSHRTHGIRENCLSVKTTKQILETLHCGKRTGSHNHAVRVADAVQYAEARLPIHPYVLGCWLGDGTSSNTDITIGAQDQPELTRILMQYEQLDYRREKNGVGTYRLGFASNKHVGSRFRCFFHKLRDVGVLNNKHIPEIYLRGSIDQRMDLLRGLMDTDGTINKDGRCSFTGTRRKLVENLRELVASLGFKPERIRTDQPHATNGADGHGDCQPAYRFCFTAYKNRPVFRLVRKANRQRLEPKTRGLQNNRMIVAVSPVPSRPVKCIAIESPNHLYLAGRGYIPTHNTTYVRADIFSWILLFPNIRVVYLSGSENLAVPQLQAISRGLSQPTRNMTTYFPEYVFLPNSKWSKKLNQWKDVPVGESIGTMHHFTVPCRTNTTLPEATFQIATPEAVSSGLHSELVYCDDIVNNQTKTIEAHKKAFQNYLDVLPIVQPTGFLHVSGTRYRGGAEPDAYGRIMARASKESKWKFMVEDCLSTNCNTVLSDGLMCGRPECFHDKNTNVLQGPSITGIPGAPCPGFHSDGIVVPYCPVVPCPDGEYGYTLEFLRMQESSDPVFYALQYMNDPSLIQKGKAIFDEQIIGRQTLHTQEQIMAKFPPMLSRVYLMVDPAYSTAEFGEHRDETVILAFSHYGGDIVFWNCWAGQWGARERTQRIVQAIGTIRPVTCFIESNMNAESAEILIVDSARAAGLTHVPIASRVPKRNKGARTIRMESAAQLLDTGRIWFYAPIPFYDKIVKQMLDYPEGSHDDYADCVSQAIEAAVEVLFLLTEPHRQPSAVGQGGVPSWLNRLHQCAEPEGDDQRVAGSY